MVLFSLEDRSRKLTAELSTKFCGNAKIALNQLGFDWDEEADEKKTSHLQRIFKRVGCDRVNPSHFISGTISADVLAASLQRSKRNADDLRSPEPPALRLPAGQYVRCLGGRHRVLALQRHDPNATWWPVKLYVGLSHEVCRALAEEAANEGKCSDGEIVANILSYPEHSIDANQWWARLDKSKPRILKNILRHPGLAPDFKRVLRIPGLRPGLRLATWNKIFYCVEEVSHSLQLIYKAWLQIMGSEAALDFVDNDAVQELESRAPGISYCDEYHVELELRKGTIFRAVTDSDQRDLILHNLKQLKHLVPSIRALQEDFKYLRPCTQVMRKLVSDRNKYPVTVRTMARYAFRANEGLSSSIDHEATFLRNLKLLYLQIMQNVCQLSGQPPLKSTVDEDDYELLPYDTTAWHQLAVRAKELGFSSKEIIRLYHTDPDREMAINALHNARAPQHFDYGSSFEQMVNALVGTFKTAKPVKSKEALAELTSSHVGEPVARRCGRVYSDTYDKDRHCITIDSVTCNVQKNTDITSLFVRRSVFHAFWGWQDDQEEDQRNGQANDEGNDQGNSQNDDGYNDWDDIMDDLEPDMDEGHQRQPGQSLTSDDQEMKDAAAVPVGPRQGRRSKMATRKQLRQHRQQYKTVVRANHGKKPSKSGQQQQQGVTAPRARPRRKSLKKQRQRQIQSALTATALQEQQPVQRQPQTQQTLTIANANANAQQEEERRASTNSALTAFVSGPSQVVLQDALVTIHVRKNGEWSESECRRRDLEDAITQIRQRDPSRTFFLYNEEGRGIDLDQCKHLDDICISEAQDWSPPNIII